ncbi:uncharacterized protein [Lepeophtheirus salmonis]|uniref:uncharacterized protein n=1 Tax=Lepeophtheirus salmonis TaxID=72036 RepID=UPI001AE60662|nr:cell wall protein DAN4-like [Lepeophtheirus salmonis]XP_040574237.1 cell wall protein DAN4-like [Lepeophtheirus salmonis]
MKILHLFIPLSCLLTSITFDPVQASIFLPTPASLPKPNVPIIKRRKVKKNKKGRRQIGNEALNKLLRELELIPEPKELMQREPESSFIIRRTKEKRKKKHLQTKENVVKNVFQIQRDLSSQIQEKRVTIAFTTTTTKTSPTTLMFSTPTTKTSSKTHRITTTTQSSSTKTTKLYLPTKRTTYRSIHPLPTRLPKSISNINKTKRLYRPKDSFGQESRTLTKYTPDHHIKPMVYFKQVTPLQTTPSSTTSSTPTFPHFPIRNMSAPPTFMGREPSTVVQFKKSGTIKKDENTSTRPSWNYHRDIHEQQEEEFEENGDVQPRNFWIAPLKKKGKTTNKPELLKPSFFQEHKTPRSHFNSDSKYSSLIKDTPSKKDFIKKPTRLHLAKAKTQSFKRQENTSTPKWNISRNRLNQRRTRKTLTNKSITTRQSRSTTKPYKKLKITTLHPEELTFPSWTVSPITKEMKVKASKTIENPRPTYYQPWIPPLNKIEAIPLPNEGEGSTENYSPASWNPSPVRSKGYNVTKSTNIQHERTIHNWRGISDKEPIIKLQTTTETVPKDTKIRSSTPTTKQSQFYEPQNNYFVSKTPDSDWIPFSKENSDPLIDIKSNTHTQSRLQFLHSTSPRQNEREANQSSKDKWVQQDIKSISSPRDAKIKESPTSWNPPSFHNLKSEIYPSSQNEKDNDPEPSQNQRRKKLDPIWSQSRQSTPEPLIALDVEDSWNTTPKTIEIRQINSAALRSYPQTYRVPSPRKKQQPLRDMYDRKKYNSASYQKVNDWNVPDQYQKLLVYDPYRHKINSNGVSSLVEVDDTSTFTKPGPPYLDDEIPHYVPKLVSTTRPTTTPRPTTSTTERPIPDNLEIFEVNPHPFPNVYSWPSSEPVISTKKSPLPPYFEVEHADKYYSTDVYSPNSFAQLDNDDRSNFGRGIKDTHLVDYGAYSGSHGAFGWYADFPVELH